LSLALLFRQVRRLFEPLEEEGIWDIRILRACFDAFQIAVGDKARAKVSGGDRVNALYRIRDWSLKPSDIYHHHSSDGPACCTGIESIKISHIHNMIHERWCHVTGDRPLDRWRVCSIITPEAAGGP
jgi:hypothetical protein